MSGKEPVILPEKYYLDYFNYLLDFVEKQYDHILDQPEHLFYQAFRDLSEDAKCLYLRFSNRRGDYFRMNKIAYPEIKNVHAAKEELVLQEFISINESQETSQFKLFTKSELISYFTFLHPSQKKEEILLELTEADIPIIHSAEEIAEVKKNQEVDFLKLLFFGNRYGQMTDFVIRDVGNIRLEKLDESKFQPWFQSRQEALGVMHLSQLRGMVREIIAAELSLEEYLEEMPWKEWLSYPASKKSAEKLLLDIGQHFERKSKLELALQYFGLITRPPARERTVRLFEKLNRPDEAMALAEKMQSAPKNASELTFATDFLRKSGIRINRSMTERLKTAPAITIEKDPLRSVEVCALEYFVNEGWEGIHAENYIWRGLFGLTFWNEIFDESHGSFHHPLQRQPSDLNDSLFFESRASHLQSRINSLKSKIAFKNHLNLIYKEKNGMANRFVSWHELLLPSVLTMVDKLPLKGLKTVLLEMAKNMKENSTGFPDLFLWKKNDYQFYEIKSQNDQLSAQQLFWLNFLPEAGIKSEVLRVYYAN